MATLFASPADSLQQIFDCASPGDLILLAPGIYREKWGIRTPQLTVVGAGADQTVLIWNDYALKKDELGRDYVTFRTYTGAVTAPGVTLKKLSVVNDALQPELKGQEVALSVCADGFTMEDSLLRSTQDTLFLGPLPPDLIERYDGFLKDELRREGTCRSVFRRCRIEGTVDFIFGCGDSLLEDCEIVSLRDARGGGYIAAPAHTKSQTTGFVFHRCRLTQEEGVEPGSIFLARPWRDYGLTAFIDCEIGRHIAPIGWNKWNDSSRDTTARFAEYPAPPNVSRRAEWAGILTEAAASELLRRFK